MKILINLTILIISALSVYCQDVINPQPFDFGDDANLIIRDYNHFIKGWNWGSHPPHPQNQSFDLMNKGLISGTGIDKK